MGEAIRNWVDLTGEEFKALNRAETIVVVSCSPIEVHGPHLPVITDNLESEGLALRTIELMLERRPTLRFLRLPPLYMANDVVPQVGSIMYRVTTVIDTLLDIGRSLSRQGFRHIWVSNFHGGPRHIVAIEQAANRVSERYGSRMVSLFSLLSRRLTQRHSDLKQLLTEAIPDLDPAWLEEDSHAGFIETSMMLYLRGAQVDTDYVNLPSRGVSRSGVRRPGARKGLTQMVDAARYFAAAQHYYARETYSGNPQHATAEFGQRILEYLAGRSAEILCDLLDGKLSPESCHSPLWPLRHFLLSERFVQTFRRLIDFENPIF